MQIMKVALLLQTVLGQLPASTLMKTCYQASGTRFCAPVSGKSTSRVTTEGDTYGYCCQDASED